jgi:hypothetical protein
MCIRSSRALVSVVRSHVIVLSSLICPLEVGVQRQVPHPIPDTETLLGGGDTVNALALGI